jgi:hypothetical protein
MVSDESDPQKNQTKLEKFGMLQLNKIEKLTEEMKLLEKEIKQLKNEIDKRDKDAFNKLENQIHALNQKYWRLRSKHANKEQREMTMQEIFEDLEHCYGDEINKYFTLDQVNDPNFDNGSQKTLKFLHSAMRSVLPNRLSDLNNDEKKEQAQTKIRQRIQARFDALTELNLLHTQKVKERVILELKMQYTVNKVVHTMITKNRPIAVFDDFRQMSFTHNR